MIHVVISWAPRILTIAFKNISDVDISIPDVHPFYLRNGLPLAEAEGTDGTGGAFFVNVPPGTHSIRTTLADGKPVGEAAVRAASGFVTTMVISPNL